MAAGTAGIDTNEEITSLSTYANHSIKDCTNTGIYLYHHVDTGR